MNEVTEEVYQKLKKVTEILR